MTCGGRYRIRTRVGVRDGFTVRRTGVHEISTDEVGASGRAGGDEGNLQRRDADKARAAITAFERDYGAKFPKAVAKIVDDADLLLVFYHYPGEHWIHLRTTNPIECTFATVRLRSKVTKGPGSRAAGLAMAFKLIEAAEARWRAVNAPPGRPRPQRRRLPQGQTAGTPHRDQITPPSPIRRRRGCPVRQGRSVIVGRRRCCDTGAGLFLLRCGRHAERLRGRGSRRWRGFARSAGRWSRGVSWPGESWLAAHRH